MKSPIAFLRRLLIDLGSRCGTSTTLDLKTVQRRFEHEGWSFLTITLANFGRDLEKGLDQGFVDHNLFQGFAFTGGLPRFLGGFLDRVFDRTSGRLLDEPSVAAIHALRQFLLMWAKIEVDCTDVRKTKAIRRYIECEQEVRQNDATVDPDLLGRFRRVRGLLWSEYLAVCNDSVASGELVPKHGPGATADRLTGNEKFRQTEWPLRLESVFPFWAYAAPNLRHIDFDDEGLARGVTYLEPGQERPVKVTLVPKTLKTPRVIALEPTAMQYAQQSVLELLTQKVDADDNARFFVKSHDDGQLVNRALASRGSSDGTLATLDLSEASDRVSYQHVRALLSGYGDLFDAVDASRSRKADVFGKTIRLAKFASMGSALCFPIEALVFATVVFVGIEDELNRPLTPRDVVKLRGEVRVYGDDIIVPVRFVDSVIRALEAFGFVVNANKSFWNGKFRESCGGDYYDGHDVSIVRMRSMFPNSRRDVEELVSTVSLRNQLYSAGYLEAVAYLDDLIGKIIPFPYVEEGTALLGRLGGPIQPTHHCRDTHQPLVKGALRIDQLPINELDGAGALLKFFLKRGILPSADAEHLRRSGRAKSPRIKLGCRSPYTRTAIAPVKIKLNPWVTIG